MTKDEHEKWAALHSAAAEGKVIQFDDPAFGIKDLSPGVEIHSYELGRLRIKPDPLECWAVVNDEGKAIQYCSAEVFAKGRAAQVACRVIRMVQADD